MPRRVFDLGCEHGVIAALVLQEIDGTTLVGVDGSAPMPDLAREQLASYPDRWTLRQVNFETTTPADLAGGPFGVAVTIRKTANNLTSRAPMM